MLKKPSELFKKTNLTEDYSPQFNDANLISQYQEEKTTDSVFNLIDDYKKNMNIVEKVNILSENIQKITEEVSTKLTRNDLENAMLSQLMLLDKNFQNIRSQIKGLNKSDLQEFKQNSKEIKDIVENLLEIEIPKYKKQITKNELFINQEIVEVKEILDESISEVREDVKTQINNFSADIDNSIDSFNQQLQETSLQVKKTSDTYNKLSKIVESKVARGDEKIQEHSSLIERLSRSLKELSLIIEDNFEDYKNNQIEFESSINTRIDEYLAEHHQDLVQLKTEVFNEIEDNFEDYKNNQIEFESSINTRIDEYLAEHHQDLVQLKTEVFNEIEKIPVENLQENFERLERKIDFIREIYSKIEPEVVIKEVVKEGLLNESPEAPEVKNEDPLTPLDQNFVTLEQLNNHYRLFINRIQQQLATIGGGGETRLKYLDDIVGIATNAAAYDGKVLSYNHSLRKFEFIVGGGGGNAAITISDTPPASPSEGNLWYDSSIGRTFIYYVDIDGSQWVDASPSGGVPQNIINTWVTTGVGIHTLSNVGIGTTNPTSKLTVVGGDIRVGIDTSEGVILTSPNGSKFRLIVDNAGVLSTTLVP